ncbi:ABC transporter permease subunit [Sulfolobus sp. E5-1-F]|uniref:ABC transporter permease n=1 Tax=Saccharolobus sp. E5-1-F TaxID=2663019 RepID=UPI001297BCAB|nr:ABC transporter permease [Sulfolobus sp. E5-1-F]QGA55316.1 ABC transporter permease subunit [Sulfolobus sp. E5-1-F]
MNLKTVKYIVYKIVTYFVAFFIAITINFFIPRLMPGSALSTLIAALTGAAGGITSVTAVGGNGALIAQNIHYLEAEFGLLPQPWYIEYYHYILGIFTLHLGVSIEYYPLSVTKLIGSSIGLTLGEIIFASVVAYFLGSWIGSISAMRRGRKSDIILSIIFAIFITIPTFVLIMYLELIFSVDLRLVTISFPGFTNLSWRALLRLLNFYAIPMTSFIVSLIPGFMFGMRNTMIHTLRDNYASYAEILGFRKNNIRKMVYRNSMLPNITNFAITLGLGISSALTIEGLLAIPGTGYYFGNAITSRDLPLLEGIFLIIIIMLIISLAIVEIAYGILDPRVRGEQG